MTNLEPNENSHGASKIEKKFSLIKRAESFTHAGRGIYVYLRSTHNSWLHISAFILVIIASLFFNITKTEWMMVFIVSGIVFVSEAFNTAIEIDMDLTSPTFHPYAKDTKDVAAGAVLISVIVAIIVGILIFTPYILN